MDIINTKYLISTNKDIKIKNKKCIGYLKKYGIIYYIFVIFNKDLVFLPENYTKRLKTIKELVDTLNYLGER